MSYSGIEDAVTTGTPIRRRRYTPNGDEDGASGAGSHSGDDHRDGGTNVSGKTNAINIDGGANVINGVRCGLYFPTGVVFGNGRGSANRGGVDANDNDARTTEAHNDGADVDRNGADAHVDHADDGSSGQRSTNAHNDEQ